jgi:hypothetical protein
MTNEIPMPQVLLPILLLRERLLTAGTLQTQIAFARTVLAGGEHYLRTVKGNQPPLYDDLGGAGAERATRRRRAQTTDRCRTIAAARRLLSPTSPTARQCTRRGLQPAPARRSHLGIQYRTHQFVAQHVGPCMRYFAEQPAPHQLVQRPLPVALFETG